MASSASVPSAIAQSSSEFSRDLFGQIVKSTENIVFSPASVQTCVTLALFGAKGKTESEMISGLHLGTSDKDVISKRFTNLMKSSNDNLSLNIANKIYVNDALHVKKEFNAIAKKAFNSEAEPINFKEGDKAVKTINSWIESKTNNNIKNLLSDVAPETSMILVNAVHLKAKWVNEFDKLGTHKTDFWITKDSSVQVDTMMNSDDYYYAELPDLDAVAVGMPYKDSDLSMVIILPNKKDGLNNLEKKIANVNLLEIANKMTVKDVDIRLPKFTIESEFNLNDPLKKMGMSTMFSDAAEFGDLFEEEIPVKVSDVVHKAFINVDEGGTEASAATVMKIVPMSLNFDQKRFVVDHPFLYFIKNQDFIYFMGHVTKF